MPIKNTNTVVVAGAGAGKTYSLVHEYIYTLLGLDGSGEIKSPSSILAITFTDKAAAEMRARVSAKLLALATEDITHDPVKIRADELGLALPTAAQLEALAQELPAAPISTFHSFCGQLLRDYCVQANIDGNYSLLDPKEEASIMGNIATEVVLDALARDEEGVSSLVSRFLVGASGEGEGLSYFLVRIFQELGEHGVAAESINLAQIFSEQKKLVAEIYSSIDAFSSPNEGARLRLNDCQLALEKLLAAQENIEDEKDRELKVAQHFSAMRLALKGRFGNTDQRKNLVEAVVLLGSYLVAQVSFNDALVFKKLLVDFSRRISAYKDRRSAYGFGDLLARARKLLREDLLSRKAIKNSLSKILVDEFQDTSPVQEDLVSLLAENLNEERALQSHERAMGFVQLGENRLFIVGDPKQSIYGFRGADASLFGHSLNIITQNSAQCLATGKQETLSICRRSQKAVVDLVNIVAQATLPLSDDGVAFSAADQLSALREDLHKAGAIWQLACADTEELAKKLPQSLAMQIHHILNNRRDLVGGPELGQVNPGQIAILVRRIKSATPIIAALDKLGIASIMYGGDGFYQQPEIIDAIAALKLLLDSDDEMALLTVLRSNFILLPDSAFADIISQQVDWKKGLSFAAVQNFARSSLCSADLAARIDQFASLLSELRLLLHSHCVGTILKELMHRSSYLLRLTVDGHADQRYANIMKLIRLGRALKNDPFGHIERWWQMLAAPPKEAQASVKQNDDAVKIMTIHQSKGLEFKVVILTDIFSSPPSETDGILYDPSVGLALSALGRPINGCCPATTDEKLFAPTPIDLVRQRKKQRVEAEMSRLLYVAMTRARDALFIMDAVVAGEKVVERGLTLRKLLMLGREANKLGFDAYLPQIAVSAPEKVALAVSDLVPANAHANILADLASKVVVNTHHRRKIFASSLKLPEDTPIKSDKYEVSSTARLGSMAHLLIAAAWPEYEARQSMPVSELLLLLRCIQRSLGFNLCEETETMLHRVAITLAGPLKMLQQQAEYFSFEETLRYTINESTSIEGKADLIARSKSACYIVDFKSSAHAAKSSATYLQLSSYAEALRQVCDLPIYISPCLIGGSAELKWQLYDSSSKRSLLDAALPRQLY